MTKQSDPKAEWNMLRRLCYATVERMEVQGQKKGKTREKAAFEFLCGAATALKEAQHPEANHVIGFINMVISVRGFEEIERIARTD